MLRYILLALCLFVGIGWIGAQWLHSQKQIEAAQSIPLSGTFKSCTTPEGHLHISVKAGKWEIPMGGNCPGKVDVWVDKDRRADVFLTLTEEQRLELINRLQNMLEVIPDEMKEKIKNQSP